MGAVYYGAGASVALYLNGELLNPYQVQVCNLSGADGHWSNLPTAGNPYTVCFDPELGRLYGEVLGSEARKRGKQILLGPGVNIQRTPLGGRNFEFMGEDPWLTSRMAVEYIRGELNS